MVLSGDSQGTKATLPRALLTQVVGDVAQVRLHHSRVQGQVVPQQLEVPRVVLKVRLRGGRSGPCTVSVLVWLPRAVWFFSLFVFLLGPFPQHMEVPG